MRKIIRLTTEALSAIFLYENFGAYFKERFKKFPDQKITLKLRNGLKYEINTNTNEIGTLTEIWHLGIYDRFLPRLKTDSTVIDIGANIGTFSIKAAHFAHRGKVFSFEPFPKNFETLKENIAVNNFEKIITPFNIAISGRNEEIDLFYHDRDSGGGSFHRYGDLETLKSIKVKCITLDEVFKENQINFCDFLKLDCEGAEEDILLNASKETIQKIKTITIEWHDNLSRIGFDKFKEFLLKNEYQVDFDQKTGTLYAKR